MIIRRTVSIERFNIWANGLKNYVASAKKNIEFFKGYESSVKRAQIEFDDLFQYSYVLEHDCNFETGSINSVQCSLTEYRLDMVSDLSEWAKTGEFVDYSSVFVEKTREYIKQRDARNVERERIAAEKRAKAEIERQKLKELKNKISLDYENYLADTSVVKHTKADFARTYEYDYNLVLRTFRELSQL